MGNRYQGDLDPAVSPDGNRMAFSSSRDGNRHLWVAALDGTGAQPVTSGTWQDDRPAWSHDARQLAFNSDRGGIRSLWVVAADGGSPRKVIDANLSGGVTWSRDGAHLVYSAGAGAGPGLWKIAISGGIPQRLETPQFASEPAWSPTRDVIAYMSSTRVNDVSMTGIGFVDPEGKIIYALPDPPIGNGFGNGVLTWSPDGRRVAVVRQQSNGAASIWIVDPESSTPYSRLIEFPPGPRLRGIAWTRNDELIIGKHHSTSDIVLLTQK
jgi:Tol biopolymer transport system component